MTFLENQSTFWGFTVTTGSCCSHRAGRSICNLSLHIFFVIKNIPVEGENSGNLETCFDVSRRSRKMQRGVDYTRNVTLSLFGPDG
jgi:hypothetical protein